MGWKTCRGLLLRRCMTWQWARGEPAAIRQIQASGSVRLPPRTGSQKLQNLSSLASRLPQGLTGSRSQTKGTPAGWERRSENQDKALNASTRRQRCLPARWILCRALPAASGRDHHGRALRGRSPRRKQRERLNGIRFRPSSAESYHGDTDLR